MNLKGKHFYNTADFSQKEINYLIDLALKMKKVQFKKSLSGKSLAMLFFNPSLRTRLSFMMAMEKLGGVGLDFPIKEGYTFEFKEGTIMNQKTIEHVKDAAKVISKYSDAIAIRSSDLITSNSESVQVSSWDKLKQDTVLKSFMKYSQVPVINMESNVYHPCQGLGDAMTIKEKLGNPKKKKYVLTWVYHPKALPMATPNSQLLSACDLGMNVVVVHPKGWELDKGILKVMEQKAKKAGGNFQVSHSQKEAFKEADVICVKSWGALKFYGNWEKEKKIREQHKDWIVTQEKMVKTNNAIFMHCLPVRRNVEVTDEVIDSKNSVVIDEAENRMWAQMAILRSLIKS
ncbi:acetylornithine carbamoyltransferase [Candidatus Roizmanbacteria bacterium CG22_combo_CG10-13_8_21_14_all_35_9]|uniref:Acetylornithine carbamoyltransferase n=4 Tax=Candidatus Roizmaniibacteriota TaxID=1752723 RepID=A0A2M8F3F7_9BACT|nr:MAG: acetylornithine carbamoyltransferase [Candidatus Roizmanbacteria bacterium CG22_combo_CG10-13_8_21_14_all_35_9]PJC33780.1 MAG: acetylornithine carbamoyltransferase [Candidatus Roizmanbacteria bacterium CG_4_9_14_0_2_um_filter_35_15]